MYKTLNKTLTTTQIEELVRTLEKRFVRNMALHRNIQWELIRKKLQRAPRKVWSLYQMEKSGGEPDLIEFQNKDIAFCDCSPESPKERRSLCFDDIALKSRRSNKPKGSALGMAASMDIEIIDEEQYRYLQTLGEYDLKTSSWIATPREIRELGGALFGDRRYDAVFVYHNGADSYYASRGFRGILRV